MRGRPSFKVLRLRTRISPNLAYVFLEEVFARSCNAPKKGSFVTVSRQSGKPWQDPADFHARKASVVIVETDATALWLRVRGEEGVVVPSTTSRGAGQLKRLQRWAKQSRTPAERETVDALTQLHMQEHGETPRQIHYKAQAGGGQVPPHTSGHHRQAELVRARAEAHG